MPWYIENSVRWHEGGKGTPQSKNKITVASTETVFLLLSVFMNQTQQWREFVERKKSLCKNSKSLSARIVFHNSMSR